MKTIRGSSEVRRSQAIFRASRWKICSTKEIRWLVQVPRPRPAWAILSATWCISRKRPAGWQTWTTWSRMVAWKSKMRKWRCPMSQPQDTSQLSKLRYYRSEMKTVIQRYWIDLPKTSRMGLEIWEIASIVTLQAMIMNKMLACRFPRNAVVVSTKKLLKRTLIS